MKKRGRKSEDRISGLPDAILCHILSFLSTVQAVKTSVLSTRWKNVWTSVPTIDIGDYKLTRFIDGVNRRDIDLFVRFVDHVLSMHGSSNIHRFRLDFYEFEDLSRLATWIRKAVKCNVVKLDLNLFQFENCGYHPDYHPVYPYGFKRFKLPRSLYMCKTLVSLELNLAPIITINPPSGCFPSLKFLKVEICHPIVKSMEKLFSSCPILEDLIIDGCIEHYSVFTFKISAQELKRLQIMFSFYDDLSSECKIHVNVVAPKLEIVHFKDNCLTTYSLKNAKFIREAKIDLGKFHGSAFINYEVDAVDHLRRLFAEIVNVRFLSLSPPFLKGPQKVFPSSLRFNNLNHLELFLHSCCSWKLLIVLLQISPNLEYLLFQTNLLCRRDRDFCYGRRRPAWNSSSLRHYEPSTVPICLSSSLKTICVQGFQGQRDEMEAMEYLLKHGKVLNRVTLYRNNFEDKVSKFQRANNCQIEFL